MPDGRIRDTRGREIEDFTVFTRGSGTTLTMKGGVVITLDEEAFAQLTRAVAAEIMPTLERAVTRNLRRRLRALVEVDDEPSRGDQGDDGDDDGRTVRGRS